MSDAPAVQVPVDAMEGKGLKVMPKQGGGYSLTTAAPIGTGGRRRRGGKKTAGRRRRGGSEGPETVEGARRRRGGKTTAGRRRRH